MLKYQADVSTVNAISWLESNVIPLVILIVGIGVMIGARRKNHKDAMTQVLIVFVGLLLIGLTVNGNAVTTSQWLAHQFVN